jgi:hypothetical protein
VILRIQFVINALQEITVGLMLQESLQVLLDFVLGKKVIFAGQDHLPKDLCTTVSNLFKPLLTCSLPTTAHPYQVILLLLLAQLKLVQLVNFTQVITAIQILDVMIVTSANTVLTLLWQT